MKKSILKISSILLVTLFVSIFFTSCTKEKETIGIIKVVRSNGNPVQGASVVLDQQNTEPGTDPITNLQQGPVDTDAQGKAQFKYLYEAILDVSVTKEIGNDTFEGSGVIRLLRGKTEQITIEIVSTP